MDIKNAKSLGEASGAARNFIAEGISLLEAARQVAEQLKGSFGAALVEQNIGRYENQRANVVQAIKRHFSENTGEPSLQLTK